MSLNKFKDANQYQNIGCKDLKCQSIEVAGSPLSTSSEYTAIPVPNTPGDAAIADIQAIYNVVGDHMKIDCNFSNVTFPTASATLTFNIPMPSGWKGAGAGLGLVSLTGQCVNPNNGSNFQPYLSQFALDNNSIIVNMISNGPQTGVFNMSLKFSCKVVKV